MIEKVNIYKDVQALSEGFTSFVREELEKKETVNISLSGGSTPKVIFDYWSKSCLNSIDWSKLVFFWGDERCVLPDDPMSNYGMTRDLLFNKIDAISKTQIHRIHGENDPQEEVEWYTNIMEKYLPKKNGIIEFDIMMLGLGDDGHTVSIFPDQIDLWDKPVDCLIAEHPETKMKRISLSGRVVNNSRHIAFLVTGKNKAEKVKEIIQQREHFFNKYPAARVNPQEGTLHWFLDEDAASLL